MPEPDLNKCPKCGLGVISEELLLHKCLIVTDFWVIGGTIWIGDGIRYYPLNNRHLTAKKTTEDGTESSNRLCQIYVGFSMCKKTSGRRNKLLIFNGAQKDCTFVNFLLRMYSLLLDLCDHGKNSRLSFYLAHSHKFLHHMQVFHILSKLT